MGARCGWPTCRCGTAGGTAWSRRGRPFTELARNWSCDLQVHRLDAQRRAETLSWTDPATGLQVRCEAVVYEDFPTVEWTLHFKNTGTTDTPILENIQALDLALDR